MPARLPSSSTRSRRCTPELSGSSPGSAYRCVIGSAAGFSTRKTPGAAVAGPSGTSPRRPHHQVPRILGAIVDTVLLLRGANCSRFPSWCRIDLTTAPRPVRRCRDGVDQAEEVRDPIEPSSCRSHDAARRRRHGRAARAASRLLRRGPGACSASAGVSPRRVAVGIQMEPLALLLAVLAGTARLIVRPDIFVNVVGEYASTTTG